jgi:PKD repeat protein
MGIVAAMPSIISRASILRRVLFAALPLAVALAGSLVSHAYAAEGSQYPLGQYGEVTRFGGFDTTWLDDGVDTGKLGGSSGTDTSPTPGKFVDPVGFAVDTDDEGTGATAVYVLDRVSGWGEQVGAQGTEWRLQKLSATGTPLASSEFYLPADVVEGAYYKVFVGVVGLAVNDSTGRIYTVLYGSTSKEEETTRQVDEIIDWSTTPNGSGQLVAPAGSSTVDSSATPITPASGYSHPGVISTSTQLGTTPLYEPQGLALDVTGGQDDLAIQADASKRNDGGEPQGPAIVEQVSTTSGAEIGSWSAASLTTVTNASSEDATALAAGISTNPSGSLNVLLSTPAEQGSWGLDDVQLPADLSDPTVIDSSKINPNTKNNLTFPAGNQYDDPDPDDVGNTSGELAIGGSGSAGAQVVELSNGLYASDFSKSTANAGYWAGVNNEGIRLVAPEAGGLLSNPLAPVTSVYDTLGNATFGDACNIGNEGIKGGGGGVSIAAGTNGTVWVLTTGGDPSGYEAPGGGATEAEDLTGRQVIEYSPAAAKTCAGPADTFKLGKAGSSLQSASSPLEVGVGSTVDFDASSIEYPTDDGGKPAGIYAYEWDPILGASDDPGYTTISDTITDNAFAPLATASYTYTTPGVYAVGLKLLGDFGEYDETGTVTVQTTSPPTAAFTAPAEAQTGQSVSFNASASKEAPGAHIVDYRWNFGDGSDEAQTPTDTHKYSSPGTYTVTLIVRDNDNQESAPVSQKITITSPPASKTEPGTTTTTSTSTTSTSTGSPPPPVAQIDRSATNVSPKALEKNGEVEVTLTCPATKVSCAGTVEVKTATAVAARVAKTGKAKKSVLVLGQATFSLAGGQRETLTVKLSAKGAALLKKSKRLKADVLVAAHDSYGDPGSQTLGLTLTEPAKKAAKKK